MEFIIEKENKKKTFTKEERRKYADKVKSMFKDFNNARSSVLAYAKAVSDEVFFKTKFKPNEKSEKNWKSKVKMCKLFMYFMTYSAFIWKNTYSGIPSMFDCCGRNQESDENSNKQKTALVNILEDMKFANISDKVIERSLIYGELISFTSWVMRKEEYRRPISFFETMFKTDVTKLPKILVAKAQGKNYYVDEKVIYDNPQVVSVNPEDFVFDSSQYENFDSCPKIYRTWKSVDDIINNSEYELTREECKELRNLVKDVNQSDLSNRTGASEDENKDVNGSTIEVLDFYGTFTLDDGTTLPNWHAVVVAGKYLVLFEKNKYIMNPFTFGCYVQDPDTLRGISPLYSGLDLALVQEKMLNQTVDLQSLNENKPLLAPKGFFDKEEIEMFPGKIIEFDAQLYSASSVQPINFEAGIFANNIEFLAETMSEVTGIFPNMAGAETSSRRTATEINVTTQGQTTRLSMTLDTIQQYYIIPVIEKVAKLVANFKFGNEELYVDNDNKKETIEITDDVRQGDYKYSYRDRNAINEKFNYADMVVMAIERFAKFVPIDTQAAFVWYMNQKGVEDPEKFLQMQEEIPLPVQQQLLQDPTIQQIIAGYNAQQAQGSEQNQPSLQKEASQMQHFSQSPTEIPQ